VKQNEQGRPLVGSSKPDRTGKVFVVEGTLRKCLGCERLMTRAAAARHATTVCRPKNLVNVN